MSSDDHTSPSLLDCLLRAEGPMTVHAASCCAGLSAGETINQLEGLRRAGCMIDWHPQRGARLVASGLGCWADYIEPRHAGRIGRRVTVFRQTASTQDAARRLIGGEGDDGHVIVADHQTGGRGRLGRRWFAPPGSALLMTAIVQPGALTVDRLMLGSCCAVARTVQEVAGLDAQVRWPNDVMVDGRKLAGILIETSGAAAMIGIGVNVALRESDLPAVDADQPLRATSLLMHGVALDRLILLDELLTRLDTALRHETDEALHADWRRRSCLLQERVTVESDGRRVRGRVIDVDPHHGLLLVDDSGAVHTLPAATSSLICGTSVEKGQEPEGQASEGQRIRSQRIR